jgi:hypothetical protein
MVAVPRRADIVIACRNGLGAEGESLVGSPGHARHIWSRLTAVAVVFFLAGDLGYDIVGTKPTYLESATVVFSLPRSARAPDAYQMFAPSLITSGLTMTQLMMSAQEQRTIQQAGGTGNVSMKLVNLYDEEYPNYGEPLAVLTSASLSPATAHRTFVIAANRLYQLITTWQDRVDVRPRHRISAQLIDDTGPVAQKGSQKRVLAGIAILAMVGVSVLWRFVDWRLEA